MAYIAWARETFNVSPFLPGRTTSAFAVIFFLLLARPSPAFTNSSSSASCRRISGISASGTDALSSESPRSLYSFLIALRRSSLSSKDNPTHSRASAILTVRSTFTSGFSTTPESPVFLKSERTLATSLVR